ncbi:hypothetical protein [Burkholderia multivorans]|uniref:hypothetical protein n=1 Tax=Burkholderia multivorans TaxID=87883 RepID=UPI0028701EDC|nr:hypothetical protein [Burkholderia multivorans]
MIVTRLATTPCARPDRFACAIVMRIALPSVRPCRSSALAISIALPRTGGGRLRIEGG